MSMPHSDTAHFTHSVVLRLQKIHLSQDTSPTRTNSVIRRELQMRNGQATPIPQKKKCLKKNNQQFTSSTSFGTFRSVFPKTSHAANLKQWNETLGLLCSIKIIKSKSQSVNIKDCCGWRRQIFILWSLMFMCTELQHCREHHAVFDPSISVQREGEECKRAPRRVRTWCSPTLKSKASADCPLLARRDLETIFKPWELTQLVWHRTTISVVPLDRP